MKLLLSQNYLLFPFSTLLSPALQGFGGSILLFALCFLGVHVAKFTARGWRIYDGAPTNKPPEQPSEPKAETKQTSPEPIYYIVEKKRRRSKPRYGDPKEIRFK